MNMSPLNVLFSEHRSTTEVQLDGNSRWDKHEHRVRVTCPDLAVTCLPHLCPVFSGVSSVAKSVNICVGNGFTRYINIYLKRNENSDIEHKCVLTLKYPPLSSLGA